MHNQRGHVLEQAILRAVPDVVICRLRYRLGRPSLSGANR
jgi:hypothetical protein